METKYLRPSPNLAGQLSIVGRIRAASSLLFASVPALLPNLHITLHGTATYHFADGRRRAASPVTLLGATSAAFIIEASADYEMICVGFLPIGWTRLVGFPADRLADDVIDAADVWSPGAVTSLWQAVVEADDLSTQQRRIEAFLRASARASQIGGRSVDVALQKWLEHPGSPCLDHLARQLDLSWRQIERLSRHVSGASPKALAMKYRALRAAGVLAVRGEAAMGRALDGYSDQSHMIRDFQRFVGTTPRRLLTDGQLVANATIQGRWNAGARSPLSLLS